MSAKVFFIPAAGKEPFKSLAKKTEKVFVRLGLEKEIEKDSFTALKIHFGEKGNKGFIKPLWLSSLIKRLKQKKAQVFLTDTNTLYIGHRSNSVKHHQLAYGHGFTQAALGIPVIIADGIIGRYEENVQVDFPRVKTAKVAGTFGHTDILLCLSHFTGHILTGFGAAIKNLGMGCASRAGKLEQHSVVHPRVNQEVCKFCGTCFDYCPADSIVEKNGKAFIKEDKCIGCGECLVVCTAGAIKLTWDNDKVRVQEKMAEYAAAVQKLFYKKAGYINFLIKITKDCDCMCKDAPLIVEDIGILGSLDPVAIDRASVDLVNKTAGKDVLKIHNDIDWSVQLIYGEKIGLGTNDYELIEIS